jgi:hypothetical protein
VREQHVLLYALRDTTGVVLWGGCLLRLISIVPNKSPYLICPYLCMSSIYLQCIGALSLLSGALALKMSMFRLAGSPGEADPESPLNRWWLSQSLAAEWNPLAIGLLLALHVRDDGSMVGYMGALVLTAARFVFAMRSLLPKRHWMTVGVPSMTVSYAAVFILGAKLLLDA